MNSTSLAPLLALLSANGVIAQIEWTLRQLPEPRCCATMAYDSVRQRLVLFGGVTYGSTADAVWEWDGQSWSSHLPAVRPPANEFGAMAFDAARAVTVLQVGFSFPGDAGTWEWNGNTWTHPVPAAASPGGGPIAYDSARAVTVLLVHSFPSPTTFEWNGANWIQVPTAHTPSYRQESRMVYDAARSECVLQGGNANGVPLNDTWTYDGVDWQQRTPLQAPDAEDAAAFAYDPVRQVCVYYCGSPFATGLVSDTWEWNGANWSPGPASTSPPLRGGACMAFDGQTNAVALFGGEAVTLRSDLWRFDGSTWTNDDATGSPDVAAGSLVHDSARLTNVLFAYEGSGAGDPSTWESSTTGWRQVQTAHAPTANASTCAAYDPIRQQVVLFGGYRTAVGTLDETWTYDGVDWTERQPTVVPNASEDAAMAFDEARGVAVLLDDTGTTWTWNGTDWQMRVTPVAPAGRRYAAMAYDRYRERIVLFGARYPSLNDTWEWDGTTWTQVLPANSPPADSGNSMAFDPIRARCVLFASSFAGGTATWEWDGVDWSQRPTNNVPAGQPRGLVHDLLHGRNTLLTSDGLFPFSSYLVTWDLAQTVASAATPFGNGCPGTFGVPALAIDGPHAIVDRPYALMFTNLPPNQLLITVLGSQSLPAPVDLAILGMPGCDAFITPDFLFGHVTTGSSYSWSLSVPNNPLLLGLTFYCQGLVTDPITSPVVTNAIELIVGSN